MRWDKKESTNFRGKYAKQFNSIEEPIESAGKLEKLKHGVRQEFIQGMDKKLKHIEKLSTNLTQELSLLDQEIRYIFSTIKSCDTLESTHNYFDELQKIQSVLAALIYRDKLGLEEKFYLFTKDFDRIDDYELREYIFNKLKNNEYHFGKELK